MASRELLSGGTEDRRVSCKPASRSLTCNIKATAAEVSVSLEINIALVLIKHLAFYLHHEWWGGKVTIYFFPCVVHELMMFCDMDS